MNELEILYVISSVVVIVTVLAMIRLSVSAYERTARLAMVHLAIGFVLIIAATLATVISAFLTDFQGTRSLLLVNSGMTAGGYLFVLYSLLSFE